MTPKDSCCIVDCCRTQDELRELMTAVERAKHDQIKVEGSINKSYKNVALVENVTEPGMR